MAIKRSIIPEVGLLDSYEIVHRHLPIDQPPSSFSYIVSQLNGGYVVKNGKTGVIEFYEPDSSQAQTALKKSIELLNGKGGSVKWAAGGYTLGAKLEIPPLQDFIIDGLGAKILGDKGILFDSMMDCWVFTGVVTGGVEFNPRNPVPTDKITVLTTNQIYLEDVVPATGDAWAIRLNSQYASILRNKFFFSGCNGGGLWISREAPATGIIFANDVEVGFIQLCDSCATLGSGSHSNRYKFYDVRPNSGMDGITIYEGYNICEIVYIANAGTNRGLILQPGASNNTIISCPRLLEIGWTDNSGNSTNTIDVGCAIAARVFHSVNQSIPNATWTTLAFDSERFDTNNIHDIAVNNSRLTCRTPGKYLIIGQVRFAVNATGRRGAGIYSSAYADWCGYNLTLPMSVGDTNIQVSTILDMKVGEYIELRVFQDSGTSLDVICGNDDYRTLFSMVRLR